MPGPFANDIFISYAHNDNLSGWVEKFQEDLQNRLIELQVKVTIWRDKKLGGADKFSDEIFDQLKQSAMLISIVSPSSVHSHWCQDEWKRFEEFAQQNGGFQTGNKIRAIKIVKTPLDNDDHRALFNSALGYEFYVRDKQSGRIREYGHLHQEYQDKVNDCAQEIKEILQRLRLLAEERPKPGVYVATTTDDLEKERTKIIQEIIAWGYAVYPTGALPVSAADLRSTINTELANSLISVHMVSDKRGVIPGDEEMPLSAVQFVLAEARKMDRIVWVKPGLKMHPSFADAVAAGSQQGLDTLEGADIVSLKEQLAEKLNSLKKHSDKLASNTDRRLNLYVVCDRNDHPYVEDAEDRDNALKLKAHLESNGFVLTYPPLTKREKRELQKDHRDTLRDSNAVVLYWGAADEFWFRENLRELNAARSRRRRPFAAEAIYFSQPPRSEKALYSNSLSIVLDEFDGFQPDKLRPLLEQLRRGLEVIV